MCWKVVSVWITSNERAQKQARGRNCAGVAWGWWRFSASKPLPPSGCRGTGAPVSLQWGLGWKCCGCFHAESVRHKDGGFLRLQGFGFVVGSTPPVCGIALLGPPQTHPQSAQLPQSENPKITRHEKIVKLYFNVFFTGGFPPQGNVAYRPEIYYLFGSKVLFFRGLRPYFTVFRWGIICHKMSNFPAEN